MKVGLMAKTSRPKSAGGRRGHFLLSAEARSLSTFDIARLSDDDAHDLFCAVRWPENRGEPVCPHCGSTAVVRHKSRRIFTCKSCGKQFSATVGTPFQSHKLPVSKILYAIAVFTNGAKGYPALQLSRDLNCQYKTAFVLLHKLREAVEAEGVSEPMSGTLEADGKVLFGKMRQRNHKRNRVDMRLKKNQNGKRRFAVTLRQRGGRTWKKIFREESDAAEDILNFVEPGSTVHLDENPGWNKLELDLIAKGVTVKRINHQLAYSTDGACTNIAESFFSRVERSISGIHHHFSETHGECYIGELAWREDACRINNGTQFLLIAMATATFGMSKMRGYWQRYLKPQTASSDGATS